MHTSTLNSSNLNTSTKLASLMGSATVAAAIGLAAGIGVAAAAPAQSGATLFICQDVANPDNYRITIKGTYAMNYEDAYGYLKHVNDGNYPGGPGQGGMIYQLLGDDDHGYPGDANVTGTTFIPGNRNDTEGYVKPTSAGMEYRREISVPRSAFNEDDGVFNDADELYAVATFRDGDGGIRIAYSQKIVRNFETSGVCDGCCQ